MYILSLSYLSFERIYEFFEAQPCLHFRNLPPYGKSRPLAKLGPRGESGSESNGELEGAARAG